MRVCGCGVGVYRPASGVAGRSLLEGGPLLPCACEQRVQLTAGAAHADPRVTRLLQLMSCAVELRLRTAVEELAAARKHRWLGRCRGGAGRGGGGTETAGPRFC